MKSAQHGFAAVLRRTKEITFDEVVQMEDTAVLYLPTDPSRLIGLVHRLCGLGMAILHIQVT